VISSRDLLAPPGTSTAWRVVSCADQPDLKVAPRTAPGQKAKYSLRADVFRFGSNNGRRSIRVGMSVRCNTGSAARHSITLSARAMSVPGLCERQITAGRMQREPAMRDGGIRSQFLVTAARIDSRVTTQFFSNCLIRLSNSSNGIAPLTLSPLMKKVGVALTFSTSSANFSSADSLSNRA
jgi:hypothetical protein